MSENSPQDVKAKKRRLTLTDAALELLEALNAPSNNNARVYLARVALRREVNKSLARQLKRNSDIVFLSSIFETPKLRVETS